MFTLSLIGGNGEAQIPDLADTPILGSAEIPNSNKLGEPARWLSVWTLADATSAAARLSAHRTV